MRRKILFLFLFIFCCCTLLLSGCGKKKASDGYVDLGDDYTITDDKLLEKEEESNSVPLNTVIDNYSADMERRYFINPSAANTFDDKFFYLLDGYVGSDGIQYVFDQNYQYYKINLKTGDVVPLCNIPGCAHDVNTNPDCINVKGFSGTAAGDAFWTQSKGSLVEVKDENDEKGTTLFTNSYHTEFEENYFEDKNNIRNFADFSVFENYIYFTAPSYVFRVNRGTMTAEPYIKVCDNRILASCVDAKNNAMYAVDDIAELFKIDFETGDVIKLGDNMGSPCVYGDKLYFTRYNKGIRPICVANLDGSNDEELIADGCIDYIIKDGKLFYYDSKGFFKCLDLETGEETVFYESLYDVCGISSASHIDRIFLHGKICKGDDEGDIAGMPYSVIVSVRADGSDIWVKEIDGIE